MPHWAGCVDDGYRLLKVSESARLRERQKRR